MMSGNPSGARPRRGTASLIASSDFCSISNQRGFAGAPPELSADDLAHRVRRIVLRGLPAGRQRAARAMSRARTALVYDVSSPAPPPAVAALDPSPRKGPRMNTIIGVLITFLVVILVLYLVNMLPIDGRARQIVRVIVIVIGIVSLLKYLAVF